MNSQTITEMAEVVKVEGEYAWVLPQRKSACGSCGSSSGCGTASLSKLFVNQKSEPIKLINSVDAEVGDQVLLSLDESMLVKHAVMAYGFPLLGLIAGAMFGRVLFDDSTGYAAEYAAHYASSELGSILGAIAGMVSAWMLTKKFYRPVMPQLIENFKQSNESAIK